MSLDTTNYYYDRDLINFKKIRCKKCGAEAIVNTGIILTSDPPQYNVDCPNCGRTYMFCYEVNSMI